MVSPTNARILIADDQEDSRVLLAGLLCDEYRLVTVASASEVRGACERESPDLILLDVFMADGSGLAVCRELQTVPYLRDIPVIFVTGGVDADLENACWEAGAVDYISKPVNANSLRHRVRVHLSLKLKSDYIRNLAYMDGLTGVANRNYLDTALERLIAQTVRRLSEIAVVILDVDFFKRYNDALGHLQGDECLKSLAAVLKSCARRPLDVVARYGGEEFVVILPDTDPGGAESVVKRMLKAIERLALAHPDSPHGVVTASAGGVVFKPVSVHDHCGKSRLLGAADRELYRVKSRGRNCFSLVRYQGEEIATDSGAAEE